MEKLNFLIKMIWQGESPTRAFLNERLRKEKLRGVCVDIGGGRGSEYIAFMDSVEVKCFVTDDVKAGATIDYEIDVLPYKSNSCETVLFLNVMEHIFNYQHISDEVYRITRPAGHMIGFTPFLMRYHGDPHDFFRYTDEALNRILHKSGWEHIHIEPVSKGPFMVSAHQFLRSFPKIFRVPLFLIMYILDSFFIKLRPHATSQYVLGYLFIGKK